MLEQHEQFEIEVLENLKNARFLDPLVFGGGTMLRLCHELPRYSVNLDFWFAVTKDYPNYFDSLNKHLAANYEVTDAYNKHFSLLFELRSPKYRRKLKIEIRKQLEVWSMEQAIAFSTHSSKQVLLNVHTLPQSMTNKIAAAIERHEIRDFYDLEFLLRRGVALSANAEQCQQLQAILPSFKEQDFKVSLGSLLDRETRQYYVDNRFKFLEQKINQRSNPLI